MNQHLKLNNTMGPDQISARVLKELAPSIAHILTEIYHRSYATGKVPDDWKRAYVIAIYKNGNKHGASNYQPISLTCISCTLSPAA